jgi:hypothetical protein
MSEVRKVVFHSARQVDANADNSIRCSLHNIRSMAGCSRGSTNIGVMTKTNEVAAPPRATISAATPIAGHQLAFRSEYPQSQHHR